MRIGTWNVRSTYEETDPKNIAEIMKKCALDILY